MTEINRPVHALNCIMGNPGQDGRKFKGLYGISKPTILPEFDRTKITENVWEKSSFRKTDHGLLCTPDLVYCFFEFISYTFQRESVKYINSGRISWL